MRKSEYFRIHKAKNIPIEEIERKWKLFEQERLLQDLFPGITVTSAAGGSSPAPAAPEILDYLFSFDAGDPNSYDPTSATEWEYQNTGGGTASNSYNTWSITGPDDGSIDLYRISYISKQFTESGSLVIDYNYLSRDEIFAYDWPFYWVSNLQPMGETNIEHPQGSIPVTEIYRTGALTITYNAGDWVSIGVCSYDSSGGPGILDVVINLPWTDLSTNGNNSLLSNVVYNSSYGGALSGFSSAVSTSPYRPSVDHSGYVTLVSPGVEITSFTYNAWVYPTSVNGWNTIIDQPDDSWLFGIYNGELVTYAYDIFTGYTLEPYRWYNLSLTHEAGGNTKFYVNSDLVYSTALGDSVSYSPSIIGIGAGIDGATASNEQFNGGMAIVQMYTNVLSSNQIGKIYSETALRFQNGVALTFSSFDNLNLYLAGGYGDLASWNTWFDLPANGSPFTSIEVIGKTINLIGGSGIILKEDAFSVVIVTGPPITYIGFGKDLTSIADTFGAIVSTSAGSFSQCPVLTEVRLPGLITAADSTFYLCEVLSSLHLPALTTAGPNCFQATALTAVSLPSLSLAGNSCFSSCTDATSFSLPLATSVGDSCFSLCTGATSFNIGSCTSLGSTTGDNSVFSGITGSTPITLNVDPSRLTCNGGLPDGDILSLQANNPLTVNGYSLPAVTSDSILTPIALSAEATGTVSSDGNDPTTARGFVWAHSPAPTLADNVITDSFTGEGTFTVTLLGTGNTTAYGRAFATNLLGTSYGDEITFSPFV
jgi:hypothetical protein